MDDRALRILVIDDDPRDLELIERAIDSGWHSKPEVEYVATLGDGMERLARDRFDAALLDLSLPDSEAHETISRLREISARLPVVVLTPTGDPVRYSWILSAGAQDCIWKGELTGTLLWRCFTHAVERHHTLAEMDRLARQEAALAEIGRIINGSLRIQDVFDAFAIQVARLLPVDRMTINSVDYTRRIVRSNHVWGQHVQSRGIDDTVPLDGSIAGRAVQTDAGLLFHPESMQEVLDTFPKLEPVYAAGYRSFLGVPLVSGNQPVGAMIFQTKRENSYTRRHVEFALRIGAQIAGAVSNAWLHTLTRQYADRSAKLAELGRSVIGAADFREVLSRCGSLIPSLIRTEYLGFNIVNPDGGTFTSHVAYCAESFDLKCERTLPLGESITGEVIRTGRTVRLSREYQYPDSPMFESLRELSRRGVRSSVTVPLIVGIRPIGTLAFMSRDPDAFSEVDLSFAEAIGLQVAGAVANAELLAAQDNEARQGHALAEIGRIIGSSLDFDDVFAGCVPHIQRLIQCDRITINRVDWERGIVVKAHVHGAPMPPWDKGTSYALKGTTTERILESRRSIILTGGDFDSATVRSPVAGAARSAGFRSVIMVPLVTHDRPIGSLSLHSREVSAFQDRDAKLAESIGSQIASALVNADLHRQAQRQAADNAALAELGRVVSQSLDMADIVGKCGPLLNVLVPAESIRLTTINPDGGTLTGWHVHGRTITATRHGRQIPLAGSLTERVLSTGKPVRLDEEYTSDKGRADERVATLAADGVRSSLSLPLTVDNKVIGALSFLSWKQGAFTDGVVPQAERAAAQIAGAIANAELHARTLRLAEAERRQAELENRARELQVSNDVKARVISNVTHELRTPLAGIMGFADILAKNRHGNLDDRQRRQVEMIRRGGRLLDMLIGDLLTMSRMESGHFELNIDEIVASDLVDRVVSSLSPLFDTKSQHVKLSVTGGDRVLMVDAARITQVMSNLLSNASKYSAEGTSVFVDASVDQDRFTVSIRDEGIGMSEADQARVFTRFFRADNDSTRTESGTGLGLYIAKSIVELHGGTLRFESAAGKGSTFHFTVPTICEAVRVQKAA